MRKIRITQSDPRDQFRNNPKLYRKYNEKSKTDVRNPMTMTTDSESLGKSQMELKEFSL